MKLVKMFDICKRKIQITNPKKFLFNVSRHKKHFKIKITMKNDILFIMFFSCVKPLMVKSCSLYKHAEIIKFNNAKSAAKNLVFLKDAQNVIFF